jgi:drug/metabolite transporter (DMT)-like permease
MANFFSEYPGEVSALAAALFWALATVLYARMGAHISALRLNLLKNVLAGAMLLITIWAGGDTLADMETKALVLFILSGAVGIGLGDTAYFAALRYIGARRALLLLVLSPPLTALMALFFLGETLAPLAWPGIAVTVAGVAWVITERVAGHPEPSALRLRGLACALVAVLGQSIGSVLARLVFVETAFSPLSGALLRLTGGLVVVLIGLPFDRPAPHGRFHNRRDARFWAVLPVAVFVGTYLGIWLQQVSLKYSAAGIAQTLFATSPLFVLPLAALMGERISWRAVCGALVAVGGIALLFMP